MELNRQFRLDTFIVGSNNQLAAAAARTVAETPGSTYNPLFIYSATGLGKTHLLMAIGQHVRECAPQLSVEYLTLEEFLEGFHAAVAAGQGQAFRNRFSNVAVLLVDDVQFLTHRRELQAELLRLIGELQSSERQIVLSSDRPPAEIEGLDERLVAGFAGGLLVDVGPPEMETRLAILRRRAEERGAEFAPGVLEAVAAFDVPNVRELLGMLNRLVAFQAVSDTALTPEAATTLLAGQTAPPRAPVAAPDEFTDFLSDVASTLTRQVEAWRQRVSEAVMRWQGEGYRTARLEALLAEDAPVGAEALVRQYERDIERLRVLETEMGSLDAAAAGDAVFRDPSRLPEAEAAVQRARDGIAPPPGPSAGWTLEQYVGGEANDAALQAVRTVSASPGRSYNPLVILGPAGTGKTHLLHALGNALAAAPGAIVACLSAQDFSDELVQAMERDRLDAWRSRYRRVTALLLDDLHLLAGKPQTQEELFHLFNALFGATRQLGFTSGVPPAEIEGLDDRLVSRFGEGLVARLDAPDRELRKEVARRHLMARAGEADEDLVHYLGARPADSIRAVLSMVQRVVSAAEAQNTAPSAALAREVLEGAVPRPRRSSGRVRTSGLIVSPISGVRSREKFVWRWPDATDRMMEEIG